MKLFERIERTIARLPEKQRQWFWFVLLWCLGLGTVTLIGSVIRMAMGLE